MRFSEYLLPTLREVPQEAELASHRLMLRAGLIRSLSAGVYTYLPLGWRVLQKIQGIIRQEMDAIGGQELHLPIVHPAELWARTGRLKEFGPELARFQDRTGREMVLGPTHEEVITDLIRREVRSWRRLPLMLYQIQTKFRDEPRSRGGLIRGREFTMKDAYSFHENFEDLDECYPKVYQAYLNIFRRVGLDPVAVEAAPGLMGGTGSHEFMLPSESGEDTLVQCNGCDYMANLNGAQAARDFHDGEELQLEEVPTPECYTIQAVASYLGLPQWKTAKAVFYCARGDLIRGDLEVNEAKLARILGTVEFEPATEDEIGSVGAVSGYASPIGLQDERLRVIVDDSITKSKNLVCGANKEGYHLKNVNFPRDFMADEITDIAVVRDGDLCPRCGESLQTRRGIELGHIFKLGEKYSRALGATFLDRQGQEKPLVMGCYGIGIGRLMAAVIESHHDEQGISWPASIAPFQVVILVLNNAEPRQAELGERLYAELRAVFDVLYDDRDESAGVKFNDADLIGIPLQLVIGPRGMREGQIEIRRRGERKRQGRRVSITAGLEEIVVALREQKGELTEPLSQ
jgi:prolyl-tRNA synthetase